jgi:hypothetical protein
VLWTISAVVIVRAMNQSDGHLVYAVDDAYIHMAIAKHLAQSGVWGVTPYEFSSSASSIAYPLLLALTYRVAGVNEVSPLVLNLLFATLVLVTVHVMLVLRRPAAPGRFSLLALVLLIVLAPLPAILFSGMEHTLHLLMTLVFVFATARVLVDQGTSGATSDGRWLLVLAPLLTMVRWEGSFAVAVACALLLARGRWRFATALGMVGLAPLATYGAISVAHGWYWLPNSVLLKGRVVAPGSLSDVGALLGTSFYQEVSRTPQLVLLTTIALWIFVRRSRRHSSPWETGQVLLTLFLGTVALHLAFVGAVRWFYRHDAYVVALGIAVIAFTAYDVGPRAGTVFTPATWASLPRYAATAMLAAVLLAPIASRGVVAFAHRARSTLQVPRAMTNIYEQQYQMGLFVREHYNGAGVAANDIGALNYLGDVRILDLDGLASLPVARLKRRGEMGPGSIRAVAEAQATRIVVVYDQWFERDGLSVLPAEWIKVGQWTIRNKVSVWGETVAFYGTDARAAEELRANLARFAAQLPPSVDR